MLETGNNLKQDNAGQYRVSIRFHSDGLSFSGHIPNVHHSFFYTEETFDSSNITYADSLRACLSAYPFLTWEYLSINILFSSSKYVLVPDELFSENSVNALYSSSFGDEDDIVCFSPVSELSAQVLFGINREIFFLCEQTWEKAVYTSSIVPILGLTQRQSLLIDLPQMYVIQQENLVNIACFSEGKLLYTKAFLLTETDNMLFYLLNIWQTVDFSQLKDLLFFKGISKELQERLALFIPHIRPIELPTDAFLLGTSFLKAPIDIIHLNLCE